MNQSTHLRRCASLGNEQFDAISEEFLQIQQLQLCFNHLKQSSLPLHQYAHRVKGISSRLACAGYPVKANEKIRVLLEGLNLEHEDMRQLLLTKARRWKSSNVDEEDIFVKLIALIRFFAFDREGEVETEWTTSLGNSHSRRNTCALQRIDDSYSAKEPSVDSDTTVMDRTMTSTPLMGYHHQKNTREDAVEKRDSNLMNIGMHSMCGW